MGYKRTQKELGPNPDPNIWEDVYTKEGWFRRKKKQKGAKINSVLQAHADATKLTVPAAKRILGKLEPWVRGLELGRIQVKMAAKLKESYLETGKMPFEHLKEIDLQPGREMEMLLKVPIQTWVKDEVIIKIPIRDEPFRLSKSIYTAYYFELIILWGDAMKDRGLKVDSVESKLYKRKGNTEQECVLRLNPPAKKQPWMALLKVSSLEGKELAHHPRHYAMKIMAVGG